MNYKPFSNVLKGCLICTIALAVLLVGCKKDDQTASTSFCHQTSVSVDYVSDTDNYQYQATLTFNADGRLIKDGDAYTYEWSDHQLVQRNFYTGVLQNKSTYTLDGAGRAISETNVDQAQNLVFNRTFQYDANGYLTSLSQTGSFPHTETHEWVNGNLSKTIKTTPFGDVITTTYEYDPQLVTPASYTLLPIFGKGSKNLMIQSASAYSFGGYWTTANVQYEMDQYGNVRRSIVKFVDTGVASTLTTEYLYEGCQ
ncbi:MAG: hypothetical protein ACKVU2_08110 [Saprospiraceae bacterium]